MNYLSATDLIKINVMVIGKYSPKEPVGVADADSLQMIVNQPQQEIFGKTLYPDIYSKAAILWINIIKKHPFYNANKRTAFLALHLFLSKNGYQTNIPFEKGLEKTLEIATYKGDFDLLKDRITNFLKHEGHVTKP